MFEDLSMAMAMAIMFLFLPDRYMSAGRALLLVTPSEKEGMLAELAAAKVRLMT